jgi:hypothetical protein
LHRRLGLEALVTGKLLEEGSESLVAQETLDEGPGVGVLLHQCTVLDVKLVALIGLRGKFPLKLANVLYSKLAKDVFGYSG